MHQFKKTEKFMSVFFFFFFKKVTISVEEKSALDVWPGGKELAYHAGDPGSDPNTAKQTKQQQKQFRHFAFWVSVAKTTILQVLARVPERQVAHACNPSYFRRLRSGGSWFQASLQIVLETPSLK
jgi:hypothetical protein